MDYCVLPVLLSTWFSPLFSISIDINLARLSLLPFTLPWMSSSSYPSFPYWDSSRLMYFIRVSDHHSPLKPLWWFCIPFSIKSNLNITCIGFLARAFWIVPYFCTICFINTKLLPAPENHHISLLFKTLLAYTLNEGLLNKWTHEYNKVEYESICTLKFLTVILSVLTKYEIFFLLLFLVYILRNKCTYAIFKVDK